MNTTFFKFAAYLLIFTTLKATSSTEQTPTEMEDPHKKESPLKSSSIDYLGYIEPFAITYLLHSVVKNFKASTAKTHPANETLLKPIDNWSEKIELLAFLLLSQAKRDFKSAKSLWHAAEAISGLSLVAAAAIATYYSYKAADHDAHMRKKIDQNATTSGLTALASGIVFYQSWKLLKKAFAGAPHKKTKTVHDDTQEAQAQAA